MKASISDSQAWLSKPPSAMWLGDLHPEQHVVVHAVVEKQTVAAERQQVRHGVDALEHRDQVRPRNSARRPDTRSECQ